MTYNSIFLKTKVSRRKQKEIMKILKTHYWEFLTMQGIILELMDFYSYNLIFTIGEKQSLKDLFTKHSLFRFVFTNKRFVNNTNWIYTALPDCHEKVISTLAWLLGSLEEDWSGVSQITSTLMENARKTR